MIVALNNKCNFLKDEYLNYLEELQQIKTDNKLILCPSTTYLALTDVDCAFLGSQNTSSDLMGAHTGEISAEQLKSLEVKYCLVGHSERRQNQKETNKEISKKIENLLNNGITPILCIGETLEEREKSIYKEILLKELEESIAGNDFNQIIVAYEPIWSIGTGIIPSNDQIKEVFNVIKEKYPNIKILYGGSANEQNINTLKQIAEIDGYLLGGISLHPNKLQTFLDKLDN